MRRSSNQIDRSPDDLLRLPQFDERTVAIRWHHAWFDGPFDGTIRYEAKDYWFSFYCDTDEPRNPFYYLVYPLSAEELRAADEWSRVHEKFGAEWRPLANNPDTKALPSTEDLGQRWEAHRASLPDFTKREPIAWFSSGVNSLFYGVQIEPA